MGENKKCEHKTLYENAIKGFLGIEDVKKYLDSFKIEEENKSLKFKINNEISFDIEHICTIKNNEFPENVELGKKSKVWFLVGESKERVKVLQVAGSLNIKSEIETDINRIKDGIVNIHDFSTREKKTQFWKCVSVLKTRGNEIYSKIGNDLKNNRYDCLSVYSICNVDKYKDLEELLKTNCEQKILENIHYGMNFLWNVSVNKYFIIEALFAFYTQALYWNPWRGRDDQKAINIILGVDKVDSDKIIKVKKGYWGN